MLHNETNEGLTDRTHTHIVSFIVLDYYLQYLFRTAATARGAAGPAAATLTARRSARTWTVAASARGTTSERDATSSAPSASIKTWVV